MHAASDWVSCMRLSVTWLCGLFTSGFMAGSPLFIPMLASHGAVVSVCPSNHRPCAEQELYISDIFNISFLVTIAMTLPIGLAFDMYGGYICAVVGAGLVLVSSMLLGLALCAGVVPAGLLFVLVSMSLIGSFIAGHSFLSFIWHFPQHQAFVISLQMSSYQVSAALPVGFQIVMLLTGCSLGQVLIFYSAACSLCLLGFMWAVPRQAEYFDKAKTVLRVPSPPPPKKLDVVGAVNGAVHTLRVHRRHHLEFIIACVFAVAGTFFVQNSSDVIGRSVFKTDSAGHVIVILTVASNIVVGLIVSPMLSGMADARGLPFAMCALGMALMVTLLIPSRSWFLAALVIFSNQCFVGVSPTIIQTYIVQFAAPQRLGSVIGLFRATYSSVGVLVVAILVVAANRDSAFMPVLLFSLGLGAITWTMFSLRYCKRLPPSSVVLLENDEAELAEAFPGCKNLDDVVFLTGYSNKDCLLKKLTSSRLEDYGEVVARMDVDRVGVLFDKMSIDELLHELNEDHAFLEGVDSDSGDTDVEAPLIRMDSREGKEHTSKMSLLPAADAAAVTGAARAGLPTLLVGRVPSLLTAPKKVLSPCGEDAARNINSKSCSAAAQLEKNIMQCLQMQDSKALTSVLLQEDVMLLTEVWQNLNQQQDFETFARFEKQFDQVVPKRSIACLLRQRHELKPLVVEVAKQAATRKAKRMQDKLRCV